MAGNRTLTALVILEDVKVRFCVHAKLSLRDVIESYGLMYRKMKEWVISPY